MNDAETAEIPSVQWFAIYTKPRAEKKVQLFLNKNNIESFLPLYLKKNPKTKQTSRMPLIPSYIFVHCEMNNDIWYEIVNQANVIKFVGNKNIPEPIPDHEIESLQVIVEQTFDQEAQVNIEQLSFEGKLVEITEGPFAGVVGRVINVKDKRKKIVINIENILAAISVEVDADLVECIEEYGK